MQNLIYIMGKSATGKDTIYQKIKEKLDTNIYIPYTTRPQRDGEEQGREYYFITNEQFKKMLENNKVMEYRSYNTVKANGEKDIWTYATIDDKQWKKQGNFLSIGTLESYNSILKYLKEHPEKNLNMVPVYISIDENERRKRAIKREGKQKNRNFKEMERRIKADNIDFSEQKLKEAGITENETFLNYDLHTCIENILKYVQIKTKETTCKKEKEDDER